MTDDQTKEIARAAAREAVRETLLALGIDTSNPAAMIETQADFQHLRAWRKSLATVKRQGLVSAVGVVTVGLLGLIYLHFTSR